MNNVKKIREKNAKFLAQLKVDQLFYTEALKDYDESGLRATLAKLKQDQQKEKKVIEAKLKLEKRKGEQPTIEELKKFNSLQTEIIAVEKVISKFSERILNKDKAIELIKDIETILAIIDGLSSSQRKELNNL